jgi:aminoglycoside phosphotransferase (APT) family kinase protein
MVLLRREPEAVRQALSPWLHEKIPGAERIDLTLPGGPASGLSSETFFIDATVHERGAERRLSWVLRIEASDYRIYEQPSLERQYRAMELIGRTGAAPVPKMLWYEPVKDLLGEAFFLMERIPGTAPRDLTYSEGLFADAAPAAREAMWLSAVSAMAGIHGVKAEDCAFLDRPDLGRTALDQEMAVWDSYSRWSGVPLQPVQARARLWLDDNMPPEPPVGLAWGDARLGNMIFRNNACVAVLDWETVSLCPAETDLGWWMFYDWLTSEGQGIPRLEGIPTVADTLKYWEGLTGRRANNIAWFEAFAAWRLTMIRDRAVHLWRINGLDSIPMPDPDPFLLYLERVIAG